MGKQASVLKYGASVIALTIAAVGVAPAALAQTASAKAAAPDEIIVTGSHVVTSFNSPTPVNVVGAARMQALAIPQVADALNQLPSFRATTTPASDLFRVSGAIAENAPDLRGLGVTRTLTLVDGHRFVPAGDNGAVDLNAIPSSLVKSTEIVTGGASAAYGADAVAGVVNLILDTKFTGLKVDASAGISGHGDDSNYHFSIAGGREFAGGRGHIVAGFEYQTENGIGRCENRAWCAKFTNYIGNPGFANGVSTNGLPATLALDHVNFVYNPTGIVLSAKTAGGVTVNQQVATSVAGSGQLPAFLQGLQITSGDTGTAPFQFGGFLTGNSMQGGDQSASYDWGFGGVPMVVPTWHTSFLTHGTYDVTDHIQAFGEFLYSHTYGGPVRSTNPTLTPNFQVTGTTPSPYLPASLVNAITAYNALPSTTAPIASVNIAVVLAQTGDAAIAYSRADTYRVVGGLKGDLWKDWAWDLTYEHAQNSNYTFVGNQRLAAFDSTVQATTVTPANVGTSGLALGSIVCTSTLSAPTNGCIPSNFLGGTPISAAAQAKYFLSEWQTRKLTQDDISGNVHGTLYEGWAGPIKGAVGFEYRSDDDVGATDANSALGLFAATQTTALPNTARQVTEGYVEVNLPLVADMPFIKSLSVDAAGRYTHYSAFGNAEPWKVGLEYQPNDEVMIRATTSADVREPNPAESNPNQTSIQLPLNDPFGGGTHNILNITGGNPKLSLENSRTTTFGFVLKPHFIPGLKTSVDYYNILVGGAIDSVTGINTLNACKNLNLLCNNITFTGAFKASQAASVVSVFQNLDYIHAEGWEMVADYTIDHVMGGRVDIDVNANYILHLVSIDGTGLATVSDGVTGNAGSLSTVSGVPRYKIDTVVAYTKDNWTVSAHGRYIPQGIYDSTKLGPDQVGYTLNSPIGQSRNTVSGIFYLDLNASVRLPVSVWGSNKMEVYGGINNIFDQAQPSELRLFGNPLQFDVIGRAFKVGMRAAW